MQKEKCPVCHNAFNHIDLIEGSTVRPAVWSYIQKIQPDWTSQYKICHKCLHKAQSDLIEHHLRDELGNLTESEIDVMNAIREQETITTSPANLEEQQSYGQRLADKIAEVGGSWTFIIAFNFVLITWILINTTAILSHHFDPYPFILLNLVLSCLAAIQAPIIMMSQNRQEDKDRQRAEADYKTNLKAELEIRHLHMKLDQLLHHQWKELLEIQQVQFDVLQEQIKKERHK